MTTQRTLRLLGGLVLLSCLGLPGATPTLAAQGGFTQQQLQELQRNPELVRQRIRESGLTAAQIRARLRSAGYPENLLDAYLSDAAPSAPGGGVSPNQALALAALGLPFQEAREALPADTGLVRRGGRPSRVFGVDALRRSTTQFLPLLAGPVPATYRIGPGDVVVLILTGDVEQAHALNVSREGFVVIPQVGQVYIANLTLDQIRDLLYDRLGRVYSGVRRGARATTQFDLSVASVRTNQVFVVGEVAQPGAYQVSALGTALTALYAAGGVTEVANTRQIEIRRNGAVVGALDLYDYLLQGNTQGDVQLETGDVVFVPVHGPRVSVAGAVVRRGIYEVKPGESLRDVVHAAGGFRADASLRRLTVHRILPAPERGPGPAPRAAIDVTLTPADSGVAVTIPPLDLRDGDSIVVDSLPPLSQTYTVSISGVVEKQGTFPWREGMTLRELVLLAGGPGVGADLREAEIARMPTDRSTGQLATTMRVPLDSSYLLERDPAGRYIGPPGPEFPSAGSAPEVVLEPYDQVLILRQPDFELQRTVRITGEVRFPGLYALTRKDERLTNLIARAGGLQPTAYPQGVRMFRQLDEAGRVDADLPAALDAPGGRRDIVLQPGDSIDIPEYDPTVRVIGAVNSPTTTLYVEGAGLDYYIGNAGGYAPSADKGRVSVRYANGGARVKSKFLFFSSSPTPEPGSLILVPQRDPTQRGVELLPLLSAVAQILASTVAIVAIATR